MFRSSAIFIIFLPSSIALNQVVSISESKLTSIVSKLSIMAEMQ